MPPLFFTRLRDAGQRTAKTVKPRKLVCSLIDLRFRIGNNYSFSARWFCVFCPHLLCVFPFALPFARSFSIVFGWLAQAGVSLRVMCNATNYVHSIPCACKRWPPSARLTPNNSVGCISRRFRANRNSCSSNGSAFRKHSAACRSTMQCGVCVAHGVLHHARTHSCIFPSHSA